MKAEAKVIQEKQTVESKKQAVNTENKNIEVEKII